MFREVLPQRESWIKKVEALGFNIHEAKSDCAYWGEGAAYGFTMDEARQVEQATNTLHQLCLKAVAHIVETTRRGDTSLIRHFDIPEAYWEPVLRSWEQGEKGVYGRFDLSFDGKSPPKMFEYNADTPTSLYEGSVVQYMWLEEVKPAQQQFNLLHNRLVKAWRAALPPESFVHFLVQAEVREDVITVEYMRDTCAQAGFKTRMMDIAKLQYDSESKTFSDDQGQEIRAAFKLYPWEWLVREDAAGAFINSGVNWVEPMWKMLLSNKAILPLLWQRNPDHPNLLPSFYEEGRAGSSFVVKPKLSREGANISIVREGQLVEKTGGIYNESDVIYQGFAALPQFDGYRPTIGAWVVGDSAAGFGIREDKSYVTGNMSRFVPHFIAA